MLQMIIHLPETIGKSIATNITRKYILGVITDMLADTKSAPEYNLGEVLSSAWFSALHLNVIIHGNAFTLVQ